MILTHTDIVVVLIKARSSLIDLQSQFEMLLLEVRELEAFMTLEISADKNYLKNCSFSRRLKIEAPLLTNAEGREAALTLARIHDPMLYRLRQEYDKIVSIMGVKKSQILQLESVEKLYNSSGVTKLDLEMFDNSFQAMFQGSQVSIF